MTPATEERATRRRLRALGLLPLMVACIRLDEVLVLQGSPLFGAMFSMGPPAMDKWWRVLVLAAGNFCLVAHIFVLNDWCGMSGDLRDPNRADRVFTAKGIGSRQVGYLAAFLLALSLLLLVPLGAPTLLMGLAIAALSALYSVPLLPMKGVPLFNSALHFIGGLLHFLLGYALFRGVDGRGVAIGSFFALTFVAGHLMQETRDHRSDLLNRIRTNAVRFGRARTFTAGFIAFTAGDVLLAGLALRGLAPRALMSVALLYPLHLGWTLQAWRAGLTFESVRRLQWRYRALYAIVGLVMMGALLSAR